MGYTALRNIKPETLPENALSQLLSQNPTPSLIQLHDFIKGFQFFNSHMGNYVTYELDGGIVYGAARVIRLLLIFNKDNQLTGVVHLRGLRQTNPEEHSLNRGYGFSVLGNPNPDFVQDFSNVFNSVYSKY
jgi:hypothetical protein